MKYTRRKNNTGLKRKKHKAEVLNDKHKYWDTLTSFTVFSRAGTD